MLHTQPRSCCVLCGNECLESNRTCFWWNGGDEWKKDVVVMLRADDDEESEYSYDDYDDENVDPVTKVALGWQGWGSGHVVVTQRGTLHNIHNKNVVQTALNGMWAWIDVSTQDDADDDHDGRGYIMHTFCSSILYGLMLST